MDDKLRQVQEEIAATKEKLTNAEMAATKADLTEAERQRKEDLVVSLTNLLAGLNQKELFCFRQVRYIAIEAYAILYGFYPYNL
jgi:predicted S18 family serine protease